ncbi:hypothetical protein [Plantibacter sp. M259]|uniref:hypothetical protein n=1 Tax=Plantibacter sp. M259 TaxID=2583822 RepID=UPI001F10D869|nr:hypothetical protein [Plantibacter sp. M259]
MALSATGKYVVTDPNAPVTPDPATTDAAADPAATADPAAPADPSAAGPVALPDTITGQNAAQNTCTAGRPEEDQ